MALGKWKQVADGLVILAVSPSYRKVGTYFGEDTKVSSSKQDKKIQEAAKDDFRAGRWSAGMIEAAKEAATYVPDANGNSTSDGELPPGPAWFVSFLGLVTVWKASSSAAIPVGICDRLASTGNTCRRTTIEPIELLP